MYPADLVTTIEDLEKLFYSRSGQQFLQAEDISSPFVTKTDAPVTTSTTGVYQARYGMEAWAQMNMEANTFGALPKYVWTHSGWRCITTRSGGSDRRPYGGVAEGGDIADTVKPTWAQVSTPPRTMHVPFENTEIQEFLATVGGDDATASLGEIRRYFGIEHREDINGALNQTNGTLAGNNFESIDRIVGSYAELNNCTDAANAGYDAGDLDPYASASFDRDGGASWTDAYVAHNSGTDRALTDSILQTLLQNTLNAGANEEGQWFQTGNDSWAAINQIYDPSVRYNMIGRQKFVGSINGIQTREGGQFGTKTATLFDRPLIISKDTVQETSGISRILLLDTSNPEGKPYSRLFIKMAKPTQYFEAGMNNNMPFTVGKFTTKGMFRTAGEVICSFFGVQGKARDLKS